MTRKGKEKQQKDEEEKIKKNPNSTFFPDTSFKRGATNRMEWSEIYKFIEDGEFIDEYESDGDDLVDIKKYRIHKINSRPTVLPYCDMVRWIICHTDVSTCTIVNSSRNIVGSFRKEDISNMYKLIPPTVCLDDNFMKNFIEKEVVGEEMQMVDLIREWWDDSNALKIIVNKIYSIPILKRPPMLVATILFRLYGEKYYFKFKLC